MIEDERKLYDICKSLELYEGYTEAIMDTVDNKEDLKLVLQFYDRHKDINESDFLGYVDYLSVKRYEPERIVEDGTGDVEVMTE